MKSFFKKEKSWFIRNYEIGIVLLVVSGLHVYFFRPFAQPQPPPPKTGIVECVREDFYFTPRRSGGRGGERINITVFTINGVEYFRRSNDAYGALLGKEVTINHSSNADPHSNIIRVFEIFYDGKLVTKPLKSPMLIFIPAFVLFIFSLFWCWRALVTKLKRVQEQ